MAKRKKQQLPPSAPPLTQSPFSALAALATSDVTTTGDAEGDRSLGERPPGSDEELRAKLVVRREKKGRGGKTVTRISGLSAPQRARLLGSLKKALGCGASVEGDDLVLHGSLVDRAAEWLLAHGARSVVRGN